MFCIRYELRFKSLAFYRATEFGKSMQPHFHFLIARDGVEHLSAIQSSLVLKNLWERNLAPCDCRVRGIGTADIRPYEHSLALRYCLKREYDASGNELYKDDFVSPRLLKIAARTR
jgi:hypothetical protein